jgi:hypothetical protein
VSQGLESLAVEWVGARCENTNGSGGQCSGMIFVGELRL